MWSSSSGSLGDGTTGTGPPPPVPSTERVFMRKMAARVLEQQRKTVKHHKHHDDEENEDNAKVIIIDPESSYNHSHSHKTRGDGENQGDRDLAKKRHKGGGHHSAPNKRDDVIEEIDVRRNTTTLSCRQLKKQKHGHQIEDFDEECSMHSQPSDSEEEDETSEEEEEFDTSPEESSEVNIGANVGEEPEALLVFEDFWVRTKAPLSYNMRMGHHVDDEEPVNAVARPVKCFKTKVQGGVTEEEGYLQCMTVETLDSDNPNKASKDSKTYKKTRFTLFMSTSAWKFDSKLNIKLYKNGNAHQFASSTVHISKIFRKSLQIRKDMAKSSKNFKGADSRRVILISEKAPIISTRREIRIGSLKFDIIFGSRRQLKSYAANVTKAKLTKADGEGENSIIPVTKKAKPIVETLSSSASENGSGSSFHNQTANRFPGLVVPCEKEHKEILMCQVHEPIPDFDIFPDHANHDPDHEDVEKKEREPEKTTIKTSLNGNNNDARACSLLDKKKTENDEAVTKMGGVIKELESQVTELTGKVTFYQDKLNHTVTESSSLSEEVVQLRAEKGQYQLLVQKYCEQVEILNKEVKMLAVSNDKISVKLSNQVEALKNEVKELTESRKGYEQLVQLINKMTETKTTMDPKHHTPFANKTDNANAGTTTPILSQHTLSQLQSLLKIHEKCASHLKLEV